MFKVSWPYQATMLEIVILLLPFIVAMAMVGMCVQRITAIHTIIVPEAVIYCCHGDGSDGRHVCSKYHGHTQATMVVVTMAMVVMCVQSITAIRTTISKL